MAELFVDGAMLSHVGLVRDHNEDVVLYCLPRPGDEGHRGDFLAIVADGMGGHSAGEIASDIAANTVRLIYFERDEAPHLALARAFAAANDLIYQRAATDPACQGMGTTCTAVAIRKGRLWLAHVGDSRAYIVRDKAIRQLSEDHSLVASLVREGRLTADEAAISPQRHIILQALGTKPSVEPQIWKEGLPLIADDTIVLCSDGLNDLIDDQAIAELVSSFKPYDACEKLIDAALRAGGVDNVSVGVFRFSATNAFRASAVRTTREVNLVTSADQK